MILKSELDWEIYQRKVIGVADPTQFVFDPVGPLHYPCYVKSKILPAAHKEVMSIFFYPLEARSLYRAAQELEPNRI